MKQELSPVEYHAPMWFKREDLAGGQKGRCLQFMLDEYLANSPGPHGLLSSSPGTSPQSSFSAREARRLGLPLIIVLGVNSMESALSHAPVKVAEALGAEIVLAGASQNGWKRDRKYKAMCQAYPTYFRVPEGLGPNNDDIAWLDRFYGNSAVQTMNLPDDLKTLIIPTGSGNSCISVLRGLADYNYDRLPEHIVLGILGHDDEGKMRKTVEVHMRRCLASSKLALHLFEEAERIPIYPKSEYGNKCKGVQQHDGIVFHPNYEAKLWKTLTEKRPELLNTEGNCFWIVGSEPKMEEFVHA